MAYRETGELQAAVSDLESALELMEGRRFRLHTLQDLARVYGRQLDDPEGAFEANMRIVEIGTGGARYFRGVLGAAAYLREHGEYERSLELIESLKPYRARSQYWRNAKLTGLGRTRIAMGRVDEGVEAYQELINDENYGNRYHSLEYLDLAETLAEAGQTERAIATYHQMLDAEDLRDEELDEAETALAEVSQSAEQ